MRGAMKTAAGRMRSPLADLADEQAGEPSAMGMLFKVVNMIVSTASISQSIFSSRSMNLHRGGLFLLANTAHFFLTGSMPAQDANRKVLGFLSGELGPCKGKATTALSVDKESRRCVTADQHACACMICSPGMDRSSMGFFISP